MKMSRNSEHKNEDAKIAKKEVKSRIEEAKKDFLKD